MSNRTLFILDSIKVDAVLIGVVYLFMVLLLILEKQGKRIRWLPVLMLTGYAAIYYCVVFDRIPYKAPLANLTPFWSYRQAVEEGIISQNGLHSLAQEILQNILLFVPLGMLLSWLFPKHPVLIPFLLCLAFSLLTEVLQYFTRTGMAEFDDVFNNTLGCLIGTGIIQLTRTILDKKKN